MNKRWLRIILSITIVSFLIFSKTQAYEVDTHAGLTQEIIKFYNKNFENKISEDWKAYLLDGSRREDDPPRWNNHFFDPINNKGLISSYGSGMSARDWAMDQKAQLSFKYNSVIGTILASAQQKKIENFLLTSNYTWQEAVRNFVNGEKEEAMFALGHVLHLLEDMAVPDHTRNDPHPAIGSDQLGTGSPYEIWTGQFNSKNLDLSKNLKSKKPIVLDFMESYFDELAKYSNHNFYSKDTLGIGKYNSPEPDYFGLEIDNISYGFKRDLEFGDYHLIKAKPQIIILSFNKSNLLKSDLILKDYWDRLSVKSVQYGAGLLDLFFKEVEKAKNDPNFVREARKSFIAQVVENVRNYAENVYHQFVSLVKENTSGGFEEVATFEPRNIEEKKVEVVIKKDKHIEEKPKLIERVVINKTEPVIFRDEEDEELNEFNNKIVVADVIKKEETRTASLISPLVVSKTSPQKICTFKNGDGKNPSYNDVIINEVAWMGTLTSANDEWIELKNVSGNKVDISGWQLIDQGEQIKVIFESNNKIQANGFYLLERTDDDSVPNIRADLIYVGALSNLDEGLRLFDKECNLIDEVLANKDWPAGDSLQKRTMERNSFGSIWHTYQGVGNGTPKSENSEPPVVSALSGGGGSVSSPAVVVTTTAIQTTSTLSLSAPFFCSSSLASPLFSPVILNEIAWMGTENSVNDEWLELKNITSEEVSLNGWQLIDEDSQIKIIFEANDKILANSFYLLERTDDNSVLGVSANKIYVGSLGNNNETLNLFNSNCVLIDRVEAKPDWAAGNNDEKKTMQRDSSAEQIWKTGTGTPGAENDMTQISQVVLPQVENLEAKFISSTMQVNLKWSSIVSGTFEVSFDDFVTSTTSNEISLKIKEVGRDYIFKINGAQIILRVSAFWETVYIYPDLKNSSTILVDLRYASSNFIPPLHSYPNDYSLIVFYLNKEAEAKDILSSNDNFEPASGTFSLLYQNCNGGKQVQQWLMLNFHIDACRGGGSMGQIFYVSYIMPTRLMVQADLGIKEGDYVTAAYYYRFNNLSSVSEFKLVALDKQKYYFQNNVPSSFIPTPPSDLRAVIETSTQVANLSWFASTDFDSLVFSYELNIASSTISSTQVVLDDSNWKPISVFRYSNDSNVIRRHVLKEIFSGVFYKLRLRAVDESGNYSPVVILDISY